MLKEKKCKGTGKALGFGCGDLVPVEKHGKANRIYGIGLSCGCYSKWLQETPEGKQKVLSHTLKATKNSRDLETAKKDKKKKNSLETLKVNVRNVCHNYIKLRDRHKPCISCGESWHSDFQAGHYQKAELFSTLKYDEFNIHGQCEGCNIRKDGNLSLYTVNLPKRIGLEEFKKLQYRASLEKRTDFKWDREDLIGIRKYYQEKIKELKANS